MVAFKKVKRAVSGKKKQRSGQKVKITDQNTGPQQLYEARKPGYRNMGEVIQSDSKKIRHHVSKKINNRLLNSRKPKQARKSN